MRENFTSKMNQQNKKQTIMIDIIGSPKNNAKDMTHIIDPEVTNLILCFVWLEVLRTVESCACFLSNVQMWKSGHSMLVTIRTSSH